MSRTTSEVLPHLGHYTGTMNYHRHRILPVGPGLLLTDGAKYVAEEAGAYWLMDIILLAAREWLLEGDGFCTVDLTVEGDGARLEVTDGNGNVLHEQDIEFTDFPTPGIKFFMQSYNNEPVLMLRSEY